MISRTPNFILAGAVKSGSTSLYEYLDQHPDIFMSPIKEPHYFSAGDMDFNSFRPLIRERVNQFNVKQFLASEMKKKVHRAYLSDWNDYLQLFKNVRTESAIGEASTSYLWSPSAPAAIQSKIPESRIIILLRNPVERAFAHYLMDLKNGLTKFSFGDALHADRNTLDPSWGKNSMYVETGLYCSQVKRFLSVFNRNQVLILLFDEFRSNPILVTQRIYGFLGVDETFIPDVSQKRNEAGLPKNTLISSIYNNQLIRRYVTGNLKEKIKKQFKPFFFKTSGLPELKEKERQLLIYLFKKDINELEDLIHKDLQQWLK